MHSWVLEMKLGTCPASTLSWVQFLGPQTSLIYNFHMASSCHIESHKCCMIFTAFNSRRVRIDLEVEFFNKVQLIRDQEASTCHNMRTG